MELGGAFCFQIRAPDLKKGSARYPGYGRQATVGRVHLKGVRWEECAERRLSPHGKVTYKRARFRHGSRRRIDPAPSGADTSTVAAAAARNIGVRYFRQLCR